MPNCARIKKYIVEEGPSDWKVTFDVSPSAEAVDFSALIQIALPGAVSGTTATLIEEFEQVRRTTVAVPKAAISRAELVSYFAILRWTVTIADDADESHAIYLHTLPHPDPESGEPDWQLTRIGKMVNRAKSYSFTTGNKPAAKELAAKYLFWLKRHPLYMRADALIAAPPGNKEKAFDLPEFVAHEICSELGVRVIVCEKTKTTLPQKDIGDDPKELEENLRGSYKIEGDLSGKTILVIDDIYKSGGTVKELVRACREAGATTVLSLVATKTAKYCSGFTASDWYLVSMEAANHPTEEKDD